MAVQDFITPGEIEAAPEQPELAFVELVGIAEDRLTQLCGRLSKSDFDDRACINDYQHGFENVVIGLARSFKIEPLASRGVPKLQSYDEASFRQFKSDLDHHLTQLLVQNTRRSRQETVPLSARAKDRIRQHLHALREAVAKADLTDAKRTILQKRLADFEAALDKPRLNLMEATMLAMAILGLPGAIWASADAVSKLTQNIITIVAEAKLADDLQHHLPADEPRAALLPPRKEERSEPTSTTRPEELDDEIPF